MNVSEVRRPVRSGLGLSRLPLALCALFAIAACTSTDGSYLEETASAHDPLGRATQADLRARPASGGGFLSGFGFNRSDSRRGEVYYGAENQFSAAERASLDRLRGEQFEVNLDNADIAVAARSILGEILRVSYTLDPRVAGQVSIVTARPMPAEEILLMFETALRSNGVAMVRESDRLRLMPAGEALGVAELDQSVTIQPGYGVTVLPLRHVSADTILPLLENFVARAGMVREDPGRNALIFQGTAAERAAAIDAARSFDQDWLANESVGIFPVANSNASAMIPELNRVLDLGEGGRGRNTIRVQSIDRTNSILVVARSRNLLQRAAGWIQRLDRVDASATSLRVYRVQHVDARRLASMVNGIFTGSSSISEDPAAQFPPGSTPTTPLSSGPSLSDPSNLAQRMGDRPGPAGGEEAQAPVSPLPGGGGQLDQGVRITANPENNSLLIFARPDQHKLIEQAILALDRPSAQVAIEATIAEVTLNNDLRYGVQFYLQSGNDGSIGLFQSAAKAAIGHVLPGFNLIIGPENDPRVVLDALRGITEVKVLSSPSVVVMDNKPATLQVGDEVPIVTRTAQSVTNPDAPIVNNVEFRNTGVILNVLPRVTANGTINLLIEQEISSVLGRGQTQSLTPTIAQRRVNSTISVSSGQTVLLGGLISERQEKGREGVPVLGELPIIGDAFRKTSNAAGRTELIVLIRAQVIRDSVGAQQIAEEMRSQLRLMNEPTRSVPLPRPARSLIE